MIYSPQKKTQNLSRSLSLTCPVLSILIPTRNRATYLTSAIQSALDIPSNLIEIIVSENHGSDESWEVANSYVDPRIIVLQPENPLPMHEHWEFLLNHARGRWLTFLGDDDLILPNVIEIILAVEEKFMGIEIISSRRANLMWPGTYGRESGSFSVTASSSFHIHDSKIELERAINCVKEYLILPQIYSGGFQKDSLIKRIKNLQGGKYFRSPIPDAYSCAVSLVNTYRYIELGVPLIWIGTSPSSDNLPKSKIVKNRDADYYSMISLGSICLNEAFSKEYNSWPFFVHFYEAVTSTGSIPNLLSYLKIKQLIHRSVVFLLMKNRPLHAKILTESFGVPFPSVWERRACRLMLWLDKLWYSFLERLSPVRSINQSFENIPAASNISFVLEFENFDNHVHQAANNRLAELSIDLIHRLKKVSKPDRTTLKFPPWDPRSCSS
jgi:glycosyltransferase involved in cell wall biosynthesis